LLRREDPTASLESQTAPRPATVVRTLVVWPRRHRRAPRVVDDERGAMGRASGDPGDVVQQVSSVDDGRTSAGGLDRGLEPLGPARLVRPDQTGQPRHVVLIVYIKRVEVDTFSPYDLGAGVAAVRGH